MDATLRSDSCTPRKRIPLIVWVVGGTALLALLAGIAMVASRSLVLGDRGKTIVMPSEVTITDRTFKQGEVARAKFTINNPYDHNITVTAISTSCSCTAVLSEGDERPPFKVAPGESRDFWLSVDVRPVIEPQQKYWAQVQLERDGHPIAERLVSLTITGEEELKAYPQSIRLTKLPAGERTNTRVVLYTISDTANGNLDDIQLKVDNGEQIQVHIIKDNEVVSESMPGNMKPWYVLDVTLNSSDEDRLVAGRINVFDRDKPVVSIPVECTVEQNYRLSDNLVEVAGAPGDLVERNIYYESNKPGWRDLAVGDCPAGIDVNIRPFNETSKVITIRVRIPSVLPTEEVLVNLVAFETQAVPIRIAYR
jgi:hypothetical protein